MGFLKKFAAFLVVIFAIAITWVVGMKSLEVTSESYGSYSEVAAIAGIFDAGWIPIWLPKSAINIKEAHDVDTNEAWLTFNFSSSDTFFSSCISIPRDEIVLPVEATLDRFPSFVRDIYSRLKGDTSLLMYRCNGPTSRLLAVDKDANTAYVWSVERGAGGI